MAKLTHTKQTNLLTQTHKGYLVFASVLLLVFTPIIYLLLQKLYLDDVEEGLILEKKEFVRYTLPVLKIHEIEQWNRFNRDFKIVDTIKNIHEDKISQQYFFDTLAQELEPYRVLYTPVLIKNKPYTLFIRQNLIENKDWVQEIAVIFITLLAFIILGTAIITFWLNRKIWQPFYQNLKILETFEIDKSDFSPQFSSSNINEFNRLENALNELITRAIKTYKIQQEFVENAAHELQTPVAVLKSKLDTFLQLPELTQEQMLILEQLNETTTRLSRLNKNLLLLSNIENPKNAKELCNLKEILLKNIDFWDLQCQTNHIKFIVKNSQDSTHYVNRSLAETLLSNLLLNAIRHNINNGIIEIELTQNYFRIKNTGKTSEINSSELYKRFVKIDASTQGSGLGLAIIKKVADLHSWQIQYSFEANFHIFWINF